MTSRRLFIATVAAGASALASPPLLAESRAGVCTFGIFPYLPALTIGELFAPLALDFAAALGTEIQLRTNETFEKFASELAAGSYDIALVHPFLYVDAHAEAGYSALARVDQELRAVIVSRNGRPVNRLADLRGTVLALPPPGSAVEYLLRASMVEQGLAQGVDLKLTHHPSKASCLHAVAAEQAAGCLVPSFLGSQLHAMSEMDLSPIWQSEPIVNLVIAVHPRVRPAAREQLQRRMLDWHRTDSGRELLDHLSWPGMVAAKEGDFDSVRQVAARLRAYASG